MDFWLKLEIVQLQRTIVNSKNKFKREYMTFLCHHLTIYRLKAFKNKKVITFCISVLLTLESR